MKNLILTVFAVALFVVTADTALANNGNGKSGDAPGQSADKGGQPDHAGGGRAGGEEGGGPGSPAGSGNSEPGDNPSGTAGNQGNGPNSGRGNAGGGNGNDGDNSGGDDNDGPGDDNDGPGDGDDNDNGDGGDNPDHPGGDDNDGTPDGVTPDTPRVTGGGSGMRARICAPGETVAELAPTMVGRDLEDRYLVLQNGTIVGFVDIGAMQYGLTYRGWTYESSVDADTICVDSVKMTLSEPATPAPKSTIIFEGEVVNMNGS